jgi:multiple sugar transport system permease protein/putative aldouronate transport system permease protein
MKSSEPFAPSIGRKKKFFSGFTLFLLIVPFLALVFIFSYLPLYGWSYAFYNYKPPRTLAMSEFVGWFWFQSLFLNEVRLRQTLEVLRNTFIMSGLGILFSWLPMAFAIMMSQVKISGMKRAIQTLTTLPNFISWVLVYALAFTLFSSTGAVNSILMKLGRIEAPVMFLRLNDHTWLNMLLWGIWKSLGWNAILYLAALAGIDTELYDAAEVDGAGAWAIIWYIKLPSLMPTYFVLLILSVASFLNNGFEQYYVFQNAFNQSKIQVLDLYVYNLGVVSASYPLATAVSMLKSLVSLSLLFFCNKLSKVVRGENII